MFCKIYSYFYQFFTSSTISLSDKIQVISILSALFVSVISIIISVVSIIQTHRIYKEEQLGYISIFPYKTFGAIVPSIRLQNFGKLPAKIISITTNSEDINNSNSIFINPFKNYINCTLAPNQNFTSLFCCEDGSIDVPYNNFNITIKYKTSNKTVTETFLMNFDFTESESYLEQGNKKDLLDVLNSINKNIYSITQK